MFDVLGPQVHAVPEPTDRVGHQRERVTAQQLQHADVVAHAAPRTVFGFQPLPQLLEQRRQLPVLEDAAVVHRPRAYL